MTDLRFYRRLKPEIVFFTVGVLLAVASSGILASHARLFSQKRDTAVMIGTQLPELKSSVTLLAASVEAETFFAEQALAAREEQASVYVLPATSPVARSVSLLQELSLTLGPRLERATFSPATKGVGGLKVWKGTAILRASFQEIADFLLVLGFSGDMMIRDVIAVADQEEFLKIVEAAAPMSLKAAEDFLYLDLVEYAASPDAYEERMLSDMPTGVMQHVRVMLLDAGLARVRSGFQKAAPVLRARKLWPMPLLRVTKLTRDGETWAIELEAFGR